MATYQSIFILSSIIILTSIIGEFKRFELQHFKEGRRNIFKKIGRSITNVAKKAGGAVKNVAKKAGGAVQGVAQKAGGAVQGVAKKAGGAITNVAKKAGGAVQGVVKKIKKKASSALDKLKDGFKALGKGIAGIFKKIGDIFKKIGDIFKQIGNIMKLIFVDIPIWIGMVFKWIFFDVPKWSFYFILCAFTKILNLPSCFLWYMLEIVGKILYLPFQLTFWILDLILSKSGLTSIKIQQTVDKLWWFLDDIDHFQYQFTGFHIVHYPNDVIRKCYECRGLGPFPSFPKFPGIKYKNYTFPSFFGKVKPPPKNNYLTQLLSNVNI